MSRRTFGGTLGLVLVVALASGRASAQSNGVDERARVEAATQHYAAMLKGAPVDSVVAVYAENGELTIPGVGTLKGRKAISDFLAPLSSSVTVESVEMRIDSLTVTGDSADQQGRYRQVAGPRGGATQEFRGGFHATWTRGADNQWRLARLVMAPQ
jgi:uncharacterized protein (TIGR02246 family)